MKKPRILTTVVGSYPFPDWLAALPEEATLSLYFHIPFCQSLCLYCGCNVVINRNRDVAKGYLDRLKREIDWIASSVAPNRLVEQIHWGGGTPTYLSAEQIDDLE